MHKNSDYNNTKAYKHVLLIIWVIFLCAQMENIDWTWSLKAEILMRL